MGTEWELSRRQVFGAIALFTGGKALADICEPTLPQQEGPFYPEKDLNRDADLSVIQPGMPQATGQVILISGKVTNDGCEPVAGALVEVWQACYSGKYNHSGDTHDAPLDKNFQYWGRTKTDASGNYLFKTIVPGHYPNGGNTFRPPHVHFKVHATSFFSLTTQMYFNPDSYEDPVIKAIVEKWNAYEQIDDSLKVLFTRPTPSSVEKTGTFNISLNKN